MTNYINVKIILLIKKMPIIPVLMYEAIVDTSIKIQLIWLYKIATEIKLLK